MPTPPKSDGLPPGTIMESDHEIQQALGQLAKDRKLHMRSNSQPYCPTLRPPMAFLTIFDDGQATGEIIRIRADRFVIGRTQGDLLLPHDPLISLKHASITRQQVRDDWRWVVSDLQSTNGLFIRVTRGSLADRAEVLIGGGRYRFQAAGSKDSDGTVDYLPNHQSRPTKDWTDNPPPLVPTFTEMLGNEVGIRLPLTKTEYWIGSDPSCDICRSTDPFCEPRHARLYRNAKGGWQIEHNKTFNGLWIRVAQVVAERDVQFQIGEQRFKLKV